MSIEVKNLVKSFGEKKVIDDVSFKVRRLLLWASAVLAKVLF